ncbi:hypothetical protein EMWEY_00011200 [Eimeria maxima]|uniref:Uncharacterized protein n=1 Tax=Eimeria maxima TaxID=5804 RepID=U6M0H9_EIMMA|nr:hypothetical protein EMWEY_00011200 [Eimeria maxima]CDJ57727.1 hypothetical protein EMWEY_00011200 [Eimeria maxima]
MLVSAVGHGNALHEDDHSSVRRKACNCASPKAEVYSAVQDSVNRVANCLAEVHRAAATGAQGAVVWLRQLDGGEFELYEKKAQGQSLWFGVWWFVGDELRCILGRTSCNGGDSQLTACLRTLRKSADSPGGQSIYQSGQGEFVRLFPYLAHVQDIGQQVWLGVERLGNCARVSLLSRINNTGSQTAPAAFEDETGVDR